MGAAVKFISARSLTVDSRMFNGKSYEVTRSRRYRVG